MLLSVSEISSVSVEVAYTPWTRMHEDFAGPMDGRMYLIVVDAHSKWLEVLPMTTATALTTIPKDILCKVWSTEFLVSNNGPQSSAAEFTIM